jgi:hypothetical protein
MMAINSLQLRPALTFSWESAVVCYPAGGAVAGLAARIWASGGGGVRATMPRALRVSVGGFQWRSRNGIVLRLTKRTILEIESRECIFILLSVHEVEDVRRAASLLLLWRSDT